MRNLSVEKNNKGFLNSNTFILSAFFAVFLIGLALFYVGYRVDNKYMVPRHPSASGVTTLSMEEYENSPFLYLVDGWELYKDKEITPSEINYEIPDKYFYIGQYSGFDFGEADKSPYGKATYRLTIFSDSVRREYALEVPEINSDWKIYINNELWADSDKNSSLTKGGMISFFANEEIEIVVQASDNESLYGGLVYPPAFGSPEMVRKVLNQRILVHAGAAAIALAIGVLCLFVALFRKPDKTPFLLALLCVCFILSTIYPVINSLSVQHKTWLMLERVGYYGVFLLITVIQSKICSVSRKLYLPIIIFGIAVEISVVLISIMKIPVAKYLYFYSGVLLAYKIITAIWLIVTSFIAVKKKIDHSTILLFGFALFASALIIDRLFPLYEPIRFGWPVEVSGFFFVLLISIILWLRAVNLYKVNTSLQSDLEISRVQENTAVEMNEVKTKFLSNVSHELQMPITVISGYAQLTSSELEKVTTDKNEMQDNIIRIIKEADRMENMVDQLLDVTRLETDKFVINVEPLSLEELMEQVASVHFSILNTNKNKLVLNVEKNISPIVCDENRITQLLVNLLSNACRHTKKGTVFLTAYTEDENLAIEVKDTGEGIPKENLSGLFERYLQSDEQNSGKASGNGLGLYISKMIVEAHSGTISVKSEIGKGTSFKIVLPLSPPIYNEGK